MNKNPTNLGEEKLSNSRLIVEFLFFIFLLCLGNPVNIAEGKFICGIIAWVVIAARYSLKDIFSLIKPWEHSIMWSCYLLLIITGFQHYFDLKPNILRPAQYSMYSYCYGVVKSYDDDGRVDVSVAHVIEKGPYNIKGTSDYDGSDQVPKEIEGEELDDVTRFDFFFWEYYSSYNIFYDILETLIRCTIPDFFLICFILIIFTIFSEKSRCFVVDFSKYLCAHKSRNLWVLTKWVLRRIFFKILFPLCILFFSIRFFSCWIILILPVFFVTILKIRNLRRLKSLRDKGYYINNIFGESYEYCEPLQNGFVTVSIPTEFTLSGNKMLVVPSKDQWMKICSWRDSLALYRHRRDEIFCKIIKFWGKRKIKYPDDWPIN